MITTTILLLLTSFGFLLFVGVLFQFQPLVKNKYEETVLFIGTLGLFMFIVGLMSTAVHQDLIHSEKLKQECFQGEFSKCETTELLEQARNLN